MTEGYRAAVNMIDTLSDGGYLAIKHPVIQIFSLSQKSSGPHSASPHAACNVVNEAMELVAVSEPIENGKDGSDNTDKSGSYNNDDSASNTNNNTNTGNSTVNGSTAANSGTNTNAASKGVTDVPLPVM